MAPPKKSSGILHWLVESYLSEQALIALAHNAIPGESPWPPSKIAGRRHKLLKTAIDAGELNARHVAVPIAHGGTIIYLPDAWIFVTVPERRGNKRWKWLHDFCLQWAEAIGYSLPDPKELLESAQSLANRRAPRFSKGEVEFWYKQDWIPDHEVGGPPSRDEDYRAAKARFSGVSRNFMRELRHKFAPPEWSRPGRRKKLAGNNLAAKLPK